MSLGRVPKPRARPFAFAFNIVLDGGGVFDTVARTARWDGMRRSLVMDYVKYFHKLFVIIDESRIATDPNNVA